MNPRKAPLFDRFFVVLTVGLLVGLGLVVAFLLASRHPVPSPIQPAATKSQPTLAATNLPPPPGAPKPTAAVAGLTNLPDFQMRPFPVAQESANHQWTVADGKDTNVIWQLAHNPLEYERMVEENDRIQRRQLVYRKDTAAAVLQRARASGEPVKQLTLPGLDGQELQFAINHTDLEPSWQAGTFTGQLANRPNSMVTLAFKFGRESFTVVSPDDGLYLQAWPREPGQVIITSFDPDVYTAMPEGEPIKTTNTFKIAQ